MNNKDELLKEMCKNANIPKKIYENPRFFFTIKQVNNFYYRGFINWNNISDGFLDGSGDGGIDFMLIQDDTLYIIQGKTQNSMSREDIENVFTKINTTIEKIETNNITGLKPEVIQTYLNYKENLNEKDNIKIVLFANSEINQTMRKEFEKFKRSSSLKVKYDMLIYDKNDIDEQVANIDPNKKVDFGTLQIDDSNNILKYETNGIIVNISANSLKTLYGAKSKKGLFSYNLREKIAGAKVDGNIESTIAYERKEFWYRNNGITIGCEDYTINDENNTIELKGFSIINGAQTTTNIGKSENVYEGKDFYLVCKIIKTPKNMNMESAKEYLQKISIATNRQKPITPQDIKANDSLQIVLRQNASLNSLPIDIAIKRPILYDNKNINDWQKIDNIKLGQLIFSCICQKPGSAKTSSSKILDDEEIYKKVYDRKHNFDLYYDMCMLLRKYEIYKNNKRKKINEMSDDEKTDEIINQFYISKEGVLVVLAVIFKLLSKTKKVQDNNEICFVNRIFDCNDIEDIDSKIDDLFDLIIENISSIYNDKKNDLNLSNAAYFLKNNNNYETYIIPAFDKIYKQAQMGKTLRDNLNLFNTK